MIFAHTDIHIGSYENNPKLSKLEEDAFYSMMDHCVENNVDFIVIAGAKKTKYPENIRQVILPTPMGYRHRVSCTLYTVY